MSDGGGESWRGVSVVSRTLPDHGDREQSIFLAVVLVHAAPAHPGRGWIHLGIALGAYALWFVVGQATKLVRRPSEGADLGFMCVSALITFPVGIAAALAYG